MSSSINPPSLTSASAATTPAAPANVSPRQRAGKKRVGGGLGLLGGSGTGAAFFLPWFILTVTTVSGCRVVTTTTAVSTVNGRDVAGENFLTLLMLMPILFAAAVNIGTGLTRLIAPHWKLVLSRVALYWTAIALAAFFPWISNTPLPPPSSLGYGTTYVTALFGGAFNESGRSMVIALLAQALAAMLYFAYAAFVRPYEAPA